MRAQADGFPILADLETVAEAVAPPTTAAAHHHHGAAASSASAPAAAVAPVATGSGYNDPNNPAAWDRLAQCESGGNWAANTGNGYYGGIQFSLALVAGRRRHRLPPPGQPRDPDRHGPAPLEPGRLVPLARLHAASSATAEHTSARELRPPWRT